MDFRSESFGARIARGAWALVVGGLIVSFGSPALLSTAYGQATTENLTYRVTIGDVLRVDVGGRTDISGQFEVQKGGSIVLPVLGTVPAAGRTTADIGTDISRRMSLISTTPTVVAVTVAEYRSGQYYVLGAVLLPGMYIFQHPPTVWEAITEAGGPAQDADLAAVEVFSGAQSTPTKVNLTSVAAGDFSNVPRLRPGDTVRVGRLVGGTAGSVGGEDAVVYVFGAVGTQGPQPLAEAPDLVRAFIRAGPGAEVDFKNVEIVRTNGDQLVRLKVNMQSYFGKGSLAGNPDLQAGDTIHFTRDKGNLLSPLRLLSVMGTVIGLYTSIWVLSK